MLLGRATQLRVFTGKERRCELRAGTPQSDEDVGCWLQIPAHQATAHCGGHAVRAEAATGGSNQAALLKLACFFFVVVEVVIVIVIVMLLLLMILCCSCC